MRALIVAAAAALVLVGTSACASNEIIDVASDPSTSITDDVAGEWELVSAKDAAGPLALGPFPMRFVFGNWSARVLTGCYSFDTPLSPDLHLAAALSPSASCVAMSTDDERILTAIEAATTIGRTDAELHLTGDGIDLGFDLVPAVDANDIQGSWSLGSIVMGDAVQSFEGGTPTVRIAGDDISGQVGCDTFTGTLVPVSGANTITDLVWTEPEACIAMVQPGAEQTRDVIERGFLVHVSDGALQFGSLLTDDVLTWSPSV